MNHDPQWFNERRWRTHMVLVDVVAKGAKGGYWLGLMGTLGFALAGAMYGYEGWSTYGLVGSLGLSGVARVVQQRTSSAGYGSD